MTVDGRGEEHFAAFRAKMEAEGLPPEVVTAFGHYYGQLATGFTGKVADSEIRSLRDENVPSLTTLQRHSGAGLRGLDKLAVIKLNGGLGTSMGLEKAKSLLPVRQGLSFLDVTVRQVRHLRRISKVPVPLVFMNSFNTHQDTLDALAGFDNHGAGLPLAFVQHKYPKVRRADLSPAEFPSDRRLEWNPPGHGDIYTAMVTSGILKTLLERGFEYAFISNSDNLGAVFDASILGYCLTERPPFVMEVAHRTAADRKGGHLARHDDGRLVLRELAQCPEDELDAFQDVDRYRFFNTNSLWISLPALQEAFERFGMLRLDLIVNPKTVDPREPSSEPVYQLETAMGAAISAFEGAKVVEVPRARFAPVKTTADLLAVMSDCYVLTEGSLVVANPERDLGAIDITLDDRFYKKIDDFMARVPQGPPSLLGCRSLRVRGDVVFKPSAVLSGDVVLDNDSSEPLIVDGPVTA